MNADELKALQAPIKEQYRANPESARVTFHAVCRQSQQPIACDVDAFERTIVSGLHPAAGGKEGTACSGDLLLDALVACAGVTLQAVATNMSIPLNAFEIRASANADFRGTLGIDRDVPVGITDVTLEFELDTDADAEKVAKLIQLTERYCVIYQTLRNPPTLHSGRRQTS